MAAYLDYHSDGSGVGVVNLLQFEQKSMRFFLANGLADDEQGHRFLPEKLLDGLYHWMNL
jgi:hypothetical protein